MDPFTKRPQLSGRRKSVMRLKLPAELTNSARICNRIGEEERPLNEQLLCGGVNAAQLNSFAQTAPETQ